MAKQQRVAARADSSQVEPARTGVPERRRFRPVHTLALVAVGVVGVIVAFWVLSAIAGVIWGLVKVVVIIGVLAGLAWLLLFRRRR